VVMLWVVVIVRGGGCGSRVWDRGTVVGVGW
jgi:hypothetical protein